MKFDTQKAFPYPVLRPHNDDYLESEIQVTIDFDIQKDSVEVGVDISFALSSEDILQEIENGNAKYVTLISCRDTYFRYVLSSDCPDIKKTFLKGQLRGEVKILSYVVVVEEITGYESSEINKEFGPGPFAFSSADILAQDETQVFYFERDLFRPISSVFDLVKKDGLSAAEWIVSYDQDHVQIAVSPYMKEKIDSARNKTSNKAILINSLYFSSVVQAIQIIKESSEYEDYKWAKVITQKAHNEGVSIDDHPAYIVAERLMQYPLSLLDSYVFKVSEE